MTMTDTKRWIGDIRRVDPPELWPEVERRGAHGEIPDDRGRRGVQAAAVLVVALALMGALMYALRGLGPRVVAAPGPGQIVRYRMGGPPQPLAVGEGAAWAAVYHATPSNTGEPTIFRIDEATGRITPASGTLGAEWMATGDAGVWATCNVKTCGGPAALQLDPSGGEVVRSVSLPSRAHHIAVGLGSVWVTTDSGLVRIDPTRRGRVWTTFEGSFNWVGVSHDSVWATTDRGVARIDPVTGEVSTSFSFPDPCYFDATPAAIFVSSCDGGLPAGSGPDELVALDAGTGSVKYRIALDGWGQMRLAGGTLWIAGNDPTNSNFIRLVPFDASTGEPSGRPFEIERGAVRFSFPEIFPPSVFFAAGEDSIWLTDFAAGEVIRVGLPISGTGMPTPSEAPTPVESPSGEPPSNRADHGVDIGARIELYAGTVSVGSGWLWLVSHASDALIRVDPASGATTTTPVPDAQAVAYGIESVWVTTTSGELYQVDPATSSVVRTISVASGGGTVAVAGGRIWVGDNTDGKLYAVDALTKQVLFSLQVG
jgi:streptogramin lyase